MPSWPMSRGIPRAFWCAEPAGMNGDTWSESLRGGLDKIDRLVRAAGSAIRRRRKTSGNGATAAAATGPSPPARSGPSGSCSNPATAHRPKLINEAKRRLISGELAPGRSGIELEYADTVKAPSFNTCSSPWGN